MAEHVEWSRKPPGVKKIGTWREGAGSGNWRQKQTSGELHGLSRMTELM